MLTHEKFYLVKCKNNSYSNALNKNYFIKAITKKFKCVIISNMLLLKCNIDLPQFFYLNYMISKLNIKIFITKLNFFFLIFIAIHQQQLLFVNIVLLGLAKKIFVWLLKNTIIIKIVLNEDFSVIKWRSSMENFHKIYHIVLTITSPCGLMDKASVS